MWDAADYLRFADDRARPFVDLLARVPAEAPKTVVDLGCGPGNMTVTLAQRWPTATVEGIDSSAEMIDRANTDFGKTERVSFALGDIRSWAPAHPVDVLVSNATLQWVPGHLELLPALLAAVRPGGWFGFQVPGNFNEPTHTELAAVLQLPRWSARFAGVELAAPWVPGPAAYLETLLALGARADVWETTYLHMLFGDDAVLRWIEGTALRPVLNVLSEEEAGAFKAEYGERLRAAYPKNEHGTLLPYRRIFAVAHLPEGVELKGF
ncbi:MAG: trans-aconitate 2-methyltransferase [Actinomycetota bacterium]